MSETEHKARRGRWWRRLVIYPLIVLVFYVLLSGPMLAGAMKVHEEFDPPEWAVVWVWYLYVPLVKVMDHFDPVEDAWGAYLEWWFDLFGASMPG